MKHTDLIELSPSFATEVNVRRDFDFELPEQNRKKIDGYIPNKSVRIIIKQVIENSIEASDKKLHLVSASYGTGKSYLLLILANLFKYNDPGILKEFISKVHDKEDYYYDDLSSSLESHMSSNKYLVVIPNYADSDFSHALLEALKHSLVKYEIDYTPNTYYDKAIKLLQKWDSTKNPLIKNFNDQLVDIKLEHFIQQLEEYSNKAFQSFLDIYFQVVGSEFSFGHSDPFRVYEETSKHIRKEGLRGIVILYDEFGDFLSKIINNSETSGLPIQDFLASTVADQ